MCHVLAGAAFAQQSKKKPHNIRCTHCVCFIHLNFFCRALVSVCVYVCYIYFIRKPAMVLRITHAHTHLIHIHRRWGQNHADIVDIIFKHFVIVSIKKNRQLNAGDEKKKWTYIHWNNTPNGTIRNGTRIYLLRHRSPCYDDKQKLCINLTQLGKRTKVDSKAAEKKVRSMFGAEMSLQRTNPTEIKRNEQENRGILFLFSILVRVIANAFRFLISFAL